MNEEKEDLRRQVERLQGQITNLTNQVHYFIYYLFYIIGKVSGSVYIRSNLLFLFFFSWFSFIRLRTSVRENAQRDIRWRDSRCSIINRYWLQLRSQPDGKYIYALGWAR